MIDNQEMIFGLDIGTRSIVGTVGYKKDEEFIVVSQEIIEHTTRSMLDGQIHDIQAVGDTILNVKQKLEKNLGRKLEEVCIAAAGRVLKTVTTTAELRFETERAVTQEDVYSLETLGVETAFEQFSKKNKEKTQFFCVGSSIIRYFVNDIPILNLVGHKAKAISVEIIATFLPNDVVDGLTKAVEIAQLRVVNLTLEPIAAMHVAIPDRFRMLNIALVDVGAGTSDICITKGGSIVGYGMIPIAGDLITEKIAEHCLVDFETAERIKRTAEIQEIIEYTDIFLLQQTITVDGLNEVVAPVIDTMAERVAEKIIELNGGKTVSAVFVIGGGGKYNGYTQKLSYALGITSERVAIRGAEVMQNIVFEQEDIEKDSVLVTPVGICLSYYEKGNNFINILVNNKKIKVYNSGDMTVVDGIVQAGVANDDIFPKRAEAIRYKLDGNPQIARGSMGEMATIMINGVKVDLGAKIRSGDKIELTTSTRGKKANITLKKLLDSKNNITINIDGEDVVLPMCIHVNGELKTENYRVKDGDDIERVKYYTLDELLDYLKLPVAKNKVIMVNNTVASLDTKIYDNFRVVVLEKKCGSSNILSEILEEDLGRLMEDSVATKVADDAREVTGVLVVDEMVTKTPSMSEVSMTNELGDGIQVMINGMPYILTGKSNYVYVDIFDVYKIDMKLQPGKILITKLNGRTAEYLEPIKTGDIIEVEWKNL